jgi:hypothetical protein
VLQYIDMANRLLDDLQRILLREILCPQNPQAREALKAEISSNPARFRRLGAQIINTVNPGPFLLNQFIQAYGPGEYRTLNQGLAAQTFLRLAGGQNTVLKFLTHTLENDVRVELLTSDIPLVMEQLGAVESALPEAVKSEPIELQNVWITKQASGALAQEYVEGVSFDDTPVISADQAARLRNLGERSLDMLCPQGLQIDLLGTHNLIFDREGALRLVDTVPHTAENPKSYGINNRLVTDLTHIKPGRNTFASNRDMYIREAS